MDVNCKMARQYMHKVYEISIWEIMNSLLRIKKEDADEIDYELVGDNLIITLKKEAFEKE